MNGSLLHELVVNVTDGLLVGRRGNGSLGLLEALYMQSREGTRLVDGHNLHEG